MHSFSGTITQDILCTATVQSFSTVQLWHQTASKVEAIRRFMQTN